MCAMTWHFHEEIPKIPSRYTWNNTPHPCVHDIMKQEKPPNKVDQYTLWWKKKPAEKAKRMHSQADLKAILMEQCDEDVV